MSNRNRVEYNQGGRNEKGAGWRVVRVAPYGGLNLSKSNGPNRNRKIQTNQNKKGAFKKRRGTVTERERARAEMGRAKVEAEVKLKGVAQKIYCFTPEYSDRVPQNV